MSVSAVADTVVFDADSITSGGQDPSDGGMFAWAPGTTNKFWNGATDVVTRNDLVTDIAQFGNGGFMSSLATINVSSGSVRGLVFGATSGNGYALTASTSGQMLSLGDGGITVNSGAMATSTGSANLSLVLEASQTWTNNSGNALTIGGTVNVGSGTTWVLNSNAGGGITQTATAVISGAGNLTVNNGNGTTTLTAANTYSGTTTLLNGNLNLDFTSSGAPTSNILNNLANNSQLVLLGGALTLTGNNGTNSQRFNGTNVGIVGSSGASTITLNQGLATTLQIDLGALGHATGGTLNFSVAPTGSGVIATTTTGTAGSILGTWLTNGGGTSLSYATVAGTDSTKQIVAYTGGSNAGSQATLNDTSGTKNFNLTAGFTAPSTFSGNTIRLTAASSTTLTTGLISFTVNGLMNAGGGTFTVAGTKPISIGRNNELVVIANGQNISISAPIANTGTTAGAVTFTSVGGGMLTLSSTTGSSFSGGLFVNSGTVAGTAAGAFGTGTITLNNGATLSATGSGIQSNSITVAAGGSGTAVITNAITPGTPNFSGTITLNNNVTFQQVADRDITFSGAIQGKGNILLSSAGTTGAINLTGVGGSINNAGTITHTGNSTGMAIINALLDANVTGVVQSSNASPLILSNTSNAYTGGTIINAGTLGISSDHNLGANTGGLTFTGSGTLAISGQSTVLGSGRTVTVNTGAVATITQGNLGGYGFDGKVTGGGSLVFSKSTGTGNQTFTLSSTANDFQGSLSIANDATGTNGAFTVSTASLTDSAAANGSIRLGSTKVASGGGTFAWDVGAVNALTLNYRQIELVSTNGSGTISNDNPNVADTVTINTNLAVTAAGNKSLVLSGLNTGLNAFTGVISNGTLGATAVSVSKTGTGTWALGNAAGTSTNTYSGGTNIVAGTLIVRGATALGSGPITLSGGTLLLQSDVNNALFGTAATTMSASATIDVDRLSIGSNQTLKLGALNVTAVTSATLTTEANANGYSLSLGPITQTPTTASVLTIANASSLVIDGYTTNSNATPTLSFQGVGTTTITGNITQSGSGSLALDRSANAGTLILQGTSNLTGPVTITSGTIQTGTAVNGLGNTSGISIGASGILALRGDADAVFGNGTTAYPVTLSGSGATIDVDQADSAAMGTTLTLGTVNMSGAYTLNTIGGHGVSLALGAISASTDNDKIINNNIAAPGGLTIASYSEAAASNRTLTFQGSGNTTVGAIAQNSDNALSVVQAGSGILTLSGANSYSGPTVVEAGTLVVNNMISGNVQVDSGGKLMGHGSIGGTVDVASGGAVSPGNSVASETMNGLKLHGGSILYFEFADMNLDPGHGWDEIELHSGVLDLGNANSADPIKINIDALQADGATHDSGIGGGVAVSNNFVTSNSYQWLFIQTDDIRSLAATDGESLAQRFIIADDNNGSGVFGTGNAYIKPEGSGAFRVAFGNFGQGVGLYITYSAVPEPGSMLLAGLASLAAGLYGRRRRRGVVTQTTTDVS